MGDSFEKVVKDNFDSIAKNGKLASDADFVSLFKKIITPIVAEATKGNGEAYGANFKRYVDHLVSEMEADTPGPTSTSLEEAVFNLRQICLGYEEPDSA